MSELILSWLNDELQLSRRVTSFEHDFTNGFLFGEILARYNQQLNFGEFLDRYGVAYAATTRIVGSATSRCSSRRSAHCASASTATWSRRSSRERKEFQKRSSTN